MLYQKVTPSVSLQPFIECYYIWEHDQYLLQPIQVESPPNGYAAMVFVYGDRYGISNERQPATRVPGSFATGQSTANYRLHMQGKIGVAGIVFKPAALGTLFKVPMTEFTDQRIALDALIGAQAAELTEQVAEAPTPYQKAAVLEHFLLQHLARSPFTIDVADYAADIIMERKGVTSVLELADELNVSRRQLERKFTQKIGLSPKYYARIRRLSYVCSLLIKEKNPDWQDVIFKGGYYDQSHFIKDFLEFVRQNPAIYYKGHQELINFLAK